MRRLFPAVVKWTKFYKFPLFESRESICKEKNQIGKIFLSGGLKNGDSPRNDGHFKIIKC